MQFVKLWLTHCRQPVRVLQRRSGSHFQSRCSRNQRFGRGWL